MKLFRWLWAKIRRREWCTWCNGAKSMYCEDCWGDENAWEDGEEIASITKWNWDSDESPEASLDGTTLE